MKLTKSKLKQIIAEELGSSLQKRPSRLRPLNERVSYGDLEDTLYQLHHNSFPQEYSLQYASPEEIEDHAQHFAQALQDFAVKLLQRTPSS